MVTHGLLPGIIEGLMVGLDNLTFDLIGPSTVVADAAGCHAYVDIGHAERLAIVQ